MSGYIKTFKDKNNKSMFFRIGDDMLLEKHKTIWAKIESLKNNQLNTLPLYDDRYKKIKIRP